MPKYGIGSTAIEIAQASTQGAVIVNEGPATVYAEGDSSVSPFAYGYAIAPRATLTWGEGRNLWLVCANNETSSVSVMYGGTTSALSEVSAVVTGDVTATIDGPVDATITGPVTVEGTVNVGNVIQTETEITNTVTTTVSGTVDTVITAPVDITGDVDATITGPVSISGAVTVGGILTPVTVQGGGQILHNDEVNGVPAGSFTDILIDGPADGTTFYGIDVSWEILNSTDALTASDILVYINGFPGTPVHAVAVRDISPAQLGSIGLPEIVSFTTPMKTSFPLRVRVYNSQAANTLNGFLRVTGTAYAVPYTVDNGETWFGSGSLVTLVNAPAASTYITLPASFSTCKYLLQGASAGIDEMYLRQWNASTEAYDILLARASRSKYYTQAAATIAYQILEIVTPPIGRPHRVWFQAAAAGAIRLSLSEVIR